jgi:hypothetical protein
MRIVITFMAVLLACSCAARTGQSLSGPPGEALLPAPSEVTRTASLAGDLEVEAILPAYPTLNADLDGLLLRMQPRFSPAAPAR